MSQNPKFAIINRERRGRCLVVTAQNDDVNLKQGEKPIAFESGEIILHEEPLVSSQFHWNYCAGYRVCEYCLTPLETAEENCRRLTGISSLTIPYPECYPVIESSSCNFFNCPECGSHYCSKSCYKKAFKLYHNILCTSCSDVSMENAKVVRFNELIEFWKSIHYPPETTSIMLILKIICAVANDDSAQKDFCAKLQKFCHNLIDDDNQMIHKLLGKEQFQDQCQTLYNCFMRYLSCLNLDLGNNPSLKQLITYEGFLKLFCMIGRNGQGIGTSPLSVWIKNCEKLKLDDKSKKNLDQLIDNLYDQIEKTTGVQFSNAEGSGLYELQSSCNHSCEPNASIFFEHNNFKLSLRALKDLRDGDEVLISYLDEMDLKRSRKSRQKILMENYLFECSCERCDKQKDGLISDESENESECSFCHSNENEQGDIEMN